MRTSSTLQESKRSQRNTEAGYESYFSKLETSFKDSMQIIVNDPIMECFKENKESQLFMFERIKEVITQSLQEAQDEYNKEAMNRLDDMKNFTSALKQEIKQLTLKNKSLKEKLKIQASQEKCNVSLDQAKSLQIENAKLENQFEEVKKELKDSKIKLADSENLLNWKEDVIKNLEDTIIKLEKSGNDSRNELHNLTIKLTEISNQEEKYRNMYLELKSEMKNTKISDNCQECEKTNSELKKAFREVEQLKKVNAELERIKQHDFRSTLKRKEELEKELKERESSFSQKDQKIEDLEFVVKQLEQTVATFKKELTESTKRVREERKYRHGVEISMIELKDSFSELTLETKTIKDENQKSKQEVR